MNPLYSEGPLDAKICFIGEAPGEEEENARRPFVGTAGRILDRLLARAGINRQACRIENVIQARPRNNNIAEFVDLTKKTPYITPAAQQHITELIQRLSECKANVFVPLGNVPLWVLTKLKDITKRRGSILSSNQLELLGRKVIPTIHPAAGARQYIFQHFIFMDLQRIKNQSAFPEVNLLPRALRLSPSFNDVIDYINLCQEAKTIGFDIEVTRNEISHVSLSLAADDAICIPFFDGDTHYFAPDQEVTIWTHLKEVLENPQVIKVGQNITFDNTFVFMRYGIVVRPIEDTMIAAAISFPDFPKGLDFLTTAYCDGEPYYKDEGKKWIKNTFGSVLNFRRYSAMDAAVLLQIFPKQVEVLKKQGNLASYQRQKQLVEPLTYIACRGIRMEKAGLEQAARDAEDKINDLQAELDNIVGTHLNVSSVKQVKTYFYVVKGEKPYTKNKVTTVDDTALKRLAAKGYREAAIIKEIRHLRKLKGTYFEVILDPDNRLRCSWNPVGTKQGRVSSSKTIFDTGANLQNQPDEMLRLMLADPGMIMIKQDLSQAENRVVAYVANETNMIRAFEEGLDIHRHTASLIYNCPASSITDEQRQMGKRSNHGLNYAMGYIRFAVLHMMANQEAKYIVERYHMIYPRVRQWHNIVVKQLTMHRTLQNLYGRNRQFLDRWDDELFKEAYSYIPQSTIAEKLNQEGICDTYYNDTFASLDILNNIHDAMLYQVPLSLGLEEIVKFAIATKNNLEKPLSTDGRTFSIPVDTSFGFNALDMLKFSSAKLTNTPECVAKIQEFIDGQSST